MNASSSRRLVAEFVGTAFLVAAVVGSGIMAERLSNGNFGLALLANTIATGVALVALILTFGPISGAHFNPAVTPGRCHGRRTRLDSSLGLCVCTDRRRRSWNGNSSSDVRASRGFVFAPCSERWSTIPQRVRCYVWFAVCHLGKFAASFFGRPLRGRRLHHRSLLVYGINVLRKSSGHHCQIVQRYFRRHSPRGRSLVYRRSAFRRVGIDTSLPVARTQSTRAAKNVIVAHDGGGESAVVEGAAR